jgi:hypothetical protein
MDHRVSDLRSDRIGPTALRIGAPDGGGGVQPVRDRDPLEIVQGALLEGDLRTREEVEQRLRHEHLPGTRPGRDASGDVDGDTGRDALHEDAASPMEPGAGRDPVVLERGEGCQGAQDRGDRAAEHGEETIAGGGDLVSAVAAELLADRGVVT